MRKLRQLNYTTGVGGSGTYLEKRERERDCHIGDRKSYLMMCFGGTIITLHIPLIDGYLILGWHLGRSGKFFCTTSMNYFGGIQVPRRKKYQSKRTLGTHHPPIYEIALCACICRRRQEDMEPPQTIHSLSITSHSQAFPGKLWGNGDVTAPITETKPWEISPVPLGYKLEGV